MYLRLTNSTQPKFKILWFKVKLFDLNESGFICYLSIIRFLQLGYQLQLQGSSGVMSRLRRASNVEECSWRRGGVTDMQKPTIFVSTSFEIGWGLSANCLQRAEIPCMPGRASSDRGSSRAPAGGGDGGCGDGGGMCVAVGFRARKGEDAPPEKEVRAAYNIQADIWRQCINN